MSKKITYCETIIESKEKYTEYIYIHIKNVNEAYKKAIKAFKDVFPEIYTNNGLAKLNQLEYNLICHDKSKFSTDEFWPYAMRFFPINSVNPKSKDIEDGFQLAWLHHVHNNPHHPAHWTLVEDGEIKIFDMPDIYIIEMLCDWMAMSKYFNSTTLEYWQSESAQKLPMSPNTRAKVNTFMEYMRENNTHIVW